MSHSQDLVRLQWMITNDLVRELLPFLSELGMRHLIDQLGPSVAPWAMLPDDLEDQRERLLWELIERVGSSDQVA